MDSGSVWTSEQTHFIPDFDGFLPVFDATPVLWILVPPDDLRGKSRNPINKCFHCTVDTGEQQSGVRLNV